MNILILSCGSRNKIVQYFKASFAEGKIVCTDSSPYAPALYEGDVQEIVPRIDEPAYFESVLNICKRYQIRGLISLIDPELEIVAKNEELLKAVGVMPMISSVETIRNCFDKNEFAKTLCETGIDGPVTLDNLDDVKASLASGMLTFPLMVKPACGSASIGLNQVEDLDECQRLFDGRSNLIAQEWMCSDEYGVDCYVDMISGQLSSMFIKQKLKMRAGETDKAVSRKNEIIAETVKKFLIQYPYRFAGVIDIDVFFDGERCLISEVNPRFGGGYPHAHSCGIDFPFLYSNNLRGRVNPEIRGLDYEDGIVMMKYNETKILKQHELKTF